MQQPPVPEFAKVKNAPAPGVFLAERKETLADFLSIGHLGGLRRDKDYPALEMMAGMLGGGPRAASPTACEPSWAFPMTSLPRGMPATLTRACSKSPAAPKAFPLATIKAIQEEIERMRSAEVTEEEWRNAREAALNSLVFANDSRAKLFARQMTLNTTAIRTTTSRNIKRRCNP